MLWNTRLKPHSGQDVENHIRGAGEHNQLDCLPQQVGLLMKDLQHRLHSLGLSQYHDIFVDEGFDTWEILSDITEADLESLNVRLGHRRRLQRAIAESRGHGQDKALPPSVRRTSVDASYNSDDSTGASKDLNKVSSLNQTVGGSGTKRKYRRHPKQDENAPERPASAYVIFSNQIREELKGQDLSFTEIAKTVGERWQLLDPTVREVFERQAGSAKERYYADLAAYKRTDNYTRYQEYLTDFKAKHGSHTEGKRARLEPQLSSSTSHGSSRGVSIERMQDAAGPPGISDILRRVASSPSAILTQTGHVAPSLPSASLSPAASGYGLQSPTTREPYSPHIAVSATSSHSLYDLPHHSRLIASSDPRNSDCNTFSGASTTTSQSSGELPNPRIRTRNRYERLTLVPSLSHQDTTISSAGSSISAGTPYSGSLLPVLDAPKEQRFLPQPIAGAGLGSTPYSGRLRLPIPHESIGVVLNDRSGGDGQWPALLRATELARDADMYASQPPLTSSDDQSR